MPGGNALRHLHLQVFLADQCQLRHFDAAGFEACMTGRRLFLIGALPSIPIQMC